MQVSNITSEVMGEGGQAVDCAREILGYCDTNGRNCRGEQDQKEAEKHKNKRKRKKKKGKEKKK